MATGSLMGSMKGLVRDEKMISRDCALPETAIMFFADSSFDAYHLFVEGTLVSGLLIKPLGAMLLPFGENISYFDKILIHSCINFDTSLP